MRDTGADGGRAGGAVLGELAHGDGGEDYARPAEA